jgi:hypothetical protein
MSNIANGVLSDKVQTLPRRSLLLKCRMMSRYVLKRNLIVAYKKNMIFRKPIFTKFGNS